MAHVQQMIQTHPTRSMLDTNILSRCIEELYDCAQTCTACADACLGEQHIAMLRRCIRLCLDCADVCETTGRMLSRQVEPEWELLRSQLQACVIACRACGDECQQHAEMMAHCRECADACRRCEEASIQLVSALPQ